MKVSIDQKSINLIEGLSAIDSIRKDHFLRLPVPWDSGVLNTLSNFVNESLIDIINSGDICGT
ncbi:hypothetical protein ES703_98132 [subsurface metagenome]